MTAAERIQLERQSEFCELDAAVISATARRLRLKLACEQALDNSLAEIKRLRSQRDIAASALEACLTDQED